MNIWYAVEMAVPPSDSEARLALANAMNDAIDAYLVNDAHPRWLFFAKGKAQVEIMIAKSRLKRPEDLDKHFLKALAAFQNAETTTALSQLEPVSDVEIDEQIGDLYYGWGWIGPARSAYTRALDRFVAAEEPTDQVLSATNVLAKLASLRIASGACKDGSPPDPEWDARWSRLGGVHDMCKLLHDDEKPTSNVERLATTALHECLARTAGGDGDGAERRIAFLECPSFRSSFLPVFRFGLTASNVETELGRALEIGKVTVEGRGAATGAGRAAASPRPRPKPRAA